MINEIDGQLTELKSNPESQYYRLMDEYLAGAVRHETIVPPWLIAAFIVSLSLISVMLAAGILLYREIGQRRASEISLRNYQDRLVQAAQQSYLGRLVYNGT